MSEWDRVCRASSKFAGVWVLVRVAALVALIAAVVACPPPERSCGSPCAPGEVVICSGVCARPIPIGEPCSLNPCAPDGACADGGTCISLLGSTTCEPAIPLAGDCTAPRARRVILVRLEPIAATTPIVLQTLCSHPSVRDPLDPLSRQPTDATRTTRLLSASHATQGRSASEHRPAPITAVRGATP